MPHSHSVFDLFEIQVANKPDAVAVIEGEMTSYRALHQQAHQVSDYLLSTGIAEEQTVGVMMSRTSGMIAVLLGILKSGAAYVSIYGDDPIDRQRRYVAQSSMKVLVTDQVFRQKADQLRMTIASGEPYFEIAQIESIQKQQWTHCETQVKSSGLAYIMFTSGSTGEPKGVEVEHRNMIAVLQATADMLKITRDDCFLAASSLSFDLSVADIFLPLMCGGKLLIRDKKCWTDTEQLAKDILAYGVTVVATPPSLWSIVLNSYTLFPRVRIAITCGEAAQIPLASALIGICDEAWNLYGPTECTIWCTAYHITKEGLNADKHSEVSISIGHQIRGATVRVADEQGRELAHGQPGELWVTGTGLSRGYRNDATLTTAKFVFPIGETVRYYRTGDLASQDEDGNVRYFGRIDDQMQIHGRRIEPGDIESAIRTHYAVVDVAATWYSTASGSRSIVAAIVRREDALTPYILHAWLSDRLPKSMLPAHYVFMERLPLLTSGKIDRSAIRTSVESEYQGHSTSLRKLTTTEEFVIDAWKNVLKMNHINPTDHFFTIGGDSLSAVILVGRLESAMHIALPDEFIYQNFTPEMMAARRDHLRVRPKKRNVPVKQKRLHEKLMSRVERLFRRYMSRQAKRKTRTLREILHLQRLYVSVWRGHRINPDSLVVTLNPNAKERPLFWCMQAYWELAEIANAMPDHPIHGMRSGPGVVHVHNAEELIALATYYAGEIQLIQPQGSLILGGNCFGGRIMHYVAEHLQDLGRDVEVLIILEQHVTRSYQGRVHFIYGSESSSNPYLENVTRIDQTYQQLFPGGYVVDIVPGKYAELFRPVNIQRVVEILKGIMGNQNEKRGCWLLAISFLMKMLVE